MIDLVSSVDCGAIKAGPGRYRVHCYGCARTLLVLQTLRQPAQPTSGSSGIFLAALLLELIIQMFYLSLEFSHVSSELNVVGLDGLNIDVGRLAKTLLNEFNDIVRLLLLLVETDEHFGELIYDTVLLEVLAEILLLLFSCLH